MKKRLLTILMAFMMIASFMPILDGKVYAEDGYPYSVGAGTYIADQWGFYQCECTSYCAYKLNTANGVYFHNTNSHGSKWGNANHWDDFARSKGITVNNTPAVGAIAYWDSGDTGHVAWVSAVNGGNITVQEYNYGYVVINGEYHGNHKYNSRTISSSNPTGYIHIKDLSNDKTGPSYDDFHIGEIQSNQFTVMAHVTDPSGIQYVKYAVWTEKNGQDELKWYDGNHTDGNGYYWYRVPFSEHNNERGKYIVHMYAKDNAGNEISVGLTYDFDRQGPSYDDFHVGEFREGAFTVMAHVTDPNGVKYVKYAIWTEKNGQDDIIWYDGNHTDGNGYYWARVNLSDHKNERGKYIIHMYADDKAGKEISAGITYTFPEQGPSISNVKVSGISSNGYTVTCTISENGMGLSRVQFPTWTLKNGQDDIAKDWGTNTKVKGTISGNNATFTVRTSDHNNETGDYATHIYAYDLMGTSSCYAIPVINVHDHALIKTSAKSATISSEGNIEYWTCSFCGKLFSDANGKNEITKAQSVIPKLRPSTQGGQENVKTDLAVIKGLKMKAAKKAVTVKWKKVAKPKKIQSIEIEVATDSKFVNIVKQTTAKKTATSKKVKGLKSKKTYWVRVRAYKNAADGKHVSKWTVKKVKIK